jgi:preprotein translocase subunit YajC
MQQLLPLILLFGALGLMMYFMSRRQRRAAQQQQDLQSSLSVGDRVMTTSGLYGTIVSISDPASIDLEIAPGVETTWLRAAVREKVGPDLDVEDEVDEDLVDDEVEELEDADEVEDIKASTNGETKAEIASPLEHGKKA